MKEIIMRTIYAKEYEMAIEMLIEEGISCANIAKRFLHVNAKLLEKMYEEQNR